MICPPKNINIDCKMSNWTTCSGTVGSCSKTKNILQKAYGGGIPCEGGLTENCAQDDDCTAGNYVH